MDTRVSSRHSSQTLRYCLPIALAAVALFVFPTGVHAGTFAQTVPDPSGFISTAVDFLKKLWGIIFVAEIAALILYVFAFFTQSIIPSLYQSFQGNWVKNAVIVGLLAHPVMGFLVTAAESAKGGFTQ